MNRFESSLHLFLSGFTARDIAESLASFDETATMSAIREVIEGEHLAAVGVRRSGVVVGWLGRDDVTENRDPRSCHPFDVASVIADTASLNDVVRSLNSAPFIFVQTLGRVGGIICHNDLQMPAMRMWLFGLVTITELRVTQMIDEVYPQDSWRQYLSEGRLHKALDLQRMRRQRGQSPRLVDCLQLADKGRIVARDQTLRERTRFPSKRAVDDFVTALQDLRNNLAHSQDLSGDWEIIGDLASNLHRIVLGAPRAGESDVDTVS